MKKAKKMILVLALIFIALQVPTAVMAHGHGTSRKTTAAYALCNVKGCNITTTHRHNGTYFCGHSIGDGHTYHKNCNVAGCTKTTAHKHKGVTYLSCGNAGSGGHH